MNYVFCMVIFTSSSCEFSEMLRVSISVANTWFTKSNCWFSTSESISFTFTNFKPQSRQSWEHWQVSIISVFWSCIASLFTARWFLLNIYVQKSITYFPKHAITTVLLKNLLSFECAAIYYFGNKLKQGLLSRIFPFLVLWLMDQQSYQQNI